MGEQNRDKTGVKRRTIYLLMQSFSDGKRRATLYETVLWQCDLRGRAYKPEKNFTSDIDATDHIVVLRSCSSIQTLWPRKMMCCSLQPLVHSDEVKCGSVLRSATTACWSSIPLGQESKVQLLSKL
jgi:hypothetical protein